MPFLGDGVYGRLEGVVVDVRVRSGGVAREEPEEAGGEGACESDEVGGGDGGHGGVVGYGGFVVNWLVGQSVGPPSLGGLMLGLVRLDLELM